MTRRQAFAAADTRRPRLRAVSSPARATVLVVVGLLLAALLTAPGLAETANRQPYGPTRTVLVEVTQRLAAVSAAARLDLPWRTLDAAVHGTTAPVAVAPPAAADPARVEPAADPPPAADPSPTADTGRSATDTPRVTETPPVNEIPPVHPTQPTTAPSPVGDASGRPGPRVPSADAPLRVWIAGDSMWERPGPKLVARLEATGVVEVVELEFRYSTGLTRPDFFDWPAHAAAQLAALDPEVVLFLVGPNDSQPLVEDGLTHPPRTAGFDGAYTARVREMMDVLADGADQVLWIGLPVMRDGGFDQRMRDLDAAFARAAGDVGGVEHVPTRALFADADGHYADYLPGPDGSLQLVRNRDGIHLSDDGADRLARFLLDLLDDRHGLTD